MTSTASVDLLVLFSNCPLVTSEDQQTLHLDNVTISHAGRYTCTADNGVGNPVSEEVTITVLCKLAKSWQNFTSVHQKSIGGNFGTHFRKRSKKGSQLLCTDPEWLQTFFTTSLSNMRKVLSKREYEACRTLHIKSRHKVIIRYNFCKWSPFPFKISLQM